MLPQRLRPIVIAALACIAIAASPFLHSVFTEAAAQSPAQPRKS